MKVILGSGQLGLAIMDVLLMQNPNEEIVIVNRSGKIKRLLRKNIQVIASDVTDKYKLEFIVRNAEVIYSCTDVSYQDWNKFYPAISVALSHALRKSNARLVFADNLYSYGNVEGKLMNETFSHSAKTKKGLIRKKVIDELLYSGELFNKRVAIVKAADFIGPEIHKGLFGTDFLSRFSKGKKVFLFGRIDLPHTFTYIYDFAQAMINVVSHNDAFGQIWHVPNAKPLSPQEWVKLFENVSGKKAKISVMPKVIIKIAGLFNPLISEFVELSYQFEYPYLVNAQKYINRFGDHSTSPEIIVKETFDRYMQSNSLDKI